MNNEKSPLSVSVSFSTQSVEIHQKTVGELQPIPLEYLNGYTSPSGGYINYAVYKVKGINSTTNRKTTKTIEAFDEEDAIEKARENGLNPPFDILVSDSYAPTENQLSYAEDLGIIIPANACKEDVSCLISRVTDDDELPPDKWSVENAVKLRIQFSRYIGKKALSNYVTQTILSRKRNQKK